MLFCQCSQLCKGSYGRFSVFYNRYTFVKILKQLHIFCYKIQKVYVQSQRIRYQGIAGTFWQHPQLLTRQTRGNPKISHARGRWGNRHRAWRELIGMKTVLYNGSRQIPVDTRHDECLFAAPRPAKTSADTRHPAKDLYLHRDAGRMQPGTCISDQQTGLQRKRSW